MDFPKHLAHPRIGGEHFHIGKCRFERTQDGTVELAHENEIEPDERLRVIGKENARHGGAEPAR